MAMHAILVWFGYMLAIAMLLFIAGAGLIVLGLAWDVLANRIPSCKLLSTRVAVLHVVRRGPFEPALAP